MLQRLLTVDDVASYLGVTKHEVHKKHKTWAKNFGIDIIRINGSELGHLRFIPSQIEKMAQKQWRDDNE